MSDAPESGFAARLQRARDGRPEAMNQLFESVRNYLRVLAAMVLPQDLRGKADPSDVVQESLLRAHQSLPQFRGTTEPEWVAWMRRILTHILVDFQRRYGNAARDARRERSLEASVDEASHRLRNLVPAPGPTVSQRLQAAERGVAVADVLARLDPESRQVVDLRNFQGMDWKQIGDLTQRSPDAARMVWTRALSRLGKLLEERPA